MEGLITGIIFIIIIGILVFVHELGHFLAAKKSGIRVDEFAFGFKPRIWSIKKGETDYSINAIPVGGYVSMYGEDEDKGDRSFMGKRSSTKAFVLISGVLMNFVLAWFLFSFLFIVGFSPIVPGLTENKLVQLKEPVKIQEVSDGSPAKTVGMEKGDEIIKIDGKKMGSTLEATSEIYQKVGKEIRFELKRNGQVIGVKATPRKNPPEDQGALGVVLEGGKIGAKWYAAPVVGLQQNGYLAVESAKSFFSFLKNLFIKQEVGPQVSGIVGASFMTDVIRKMGFEYLVQFVALISVSLAVFNLVPIIPLDGGHLLVLLIEKIRGKKLSENQLNWVSLAGLGFILLLFVVVTYNDFKTWDIIGKVKHWF
jgi:regulator of sigma E protease